LGPATDRLRALVAFVRLARPLFLGGGFIGFALGAAAARFDGSRFRWVPICGDRRWSPRSS